MCVPIMCVPILVIRITIGAGAPESGAKCPLSLTAQGDRVRQLRRTRVTYFREYNGQALCADHDHRSAFSSPDVSVKRTLPRNWRNLV
jgi:hypothetical protein